MKVGDLVIHEKHGMGIVTEVWGVFLSCRQCFKPVTSHSKTACCGVLPAIIGGKGVYDVEFADGKTHSVHQRLLRPAPRAVKVTRSICIEDPLPEPDDETPPKLNEETATRVICGLPLR